MSDNNTTTGGSQKIKMSSKILEKAMKEGLSGFSSDDYVQALEAAIEVIRASAVFYVPDDAKKKLVYIANYVGISDFAYRIDYYGEGYSAKAYGLNKDYDLCSYLEKCGFLEEVYRDKHWRKGSAPQWQANSIGNPSYIHIKYTLTEKGKRFVEAIASDYRASEDEK